MNSKKVIVLAMSLLLVSSNMAFAQSKTPSKSALTNNVQRAAASAKKKGPTSLQLMKEIKEALKPENRKKHKYLRLSRADKVRDSAPHDRRECLEIGKSEEIHRRRVYYGQQRRQK